FFFFRFNNKSLISENTCYDNNQTTNHIEYRFSVSKSPFFNSIGTTVYCVKHFSSSTTLFSHVIDWVYYFFFFFSFRCLLTSFVIRCHIKFFIIEVQKYNFSLNKK